MVLTNPPFGTRGANQAPDRDDFTVATSNKQLNFLQHVLTILKPGGRAAVVVPDNCLFADQAGEVFEILTRGLRPAHGPAAARAGHSRRTAQGTKTNVVFFTQGRPTERVWIYDARTNVPAITKKDRPLNGCALRGVRASATATIRMAGRSGRDGLGGGPLARVLD